MVVGNHAYVISATNKRDFCSVFLNNPYRDKIKPLIDKTNKKVEKPLDIASGVNDRKEVKPKINAV